METLRFTSCHTCDALGPRLSSKVSAAQTGPGPDGKINAVLRAHSSIYFSSVEGQSCCIRAVCLQPEMRPPSLLIRTIPNKSQFTAKKTPGRPSPLSYSALSPCWVNTPQWDPIRGVRWFSLLDSFTWSCGLYTQHLLTTRGIKKQPVLLRGRTHSFCFREHESVEITSIFRAVYKNVILE